MTTPRLLALLGSGETAPTMMKPHRAMFDRLGPDPVPAVIVDTPYGFQENADDISAKAVEYFAKSVRRPVDVAVLRRPTDDDPVTVTRALAAIASARWVFAGPGSPTYSLRQWRGGELPGLLADKLAHGGAVVFASAAALTLGRRSVPVYEVYKSGDDPYWADGLDVLAPYLGPDVNVIPHYDNAEGGHHDTRYCYLGERRLRMMEDQLPEHGWVLGVDEHTGCLVDLDAGTATIVGIGTVTVRRHGRSRVIEAGTTIGLPELCDPAFVGDHGSRASLAVGAPAAVGADPDPDPDEADSASSIDPAAAPDPASVTAGAPAGAPDGVEATPLHAEIRRLEAAFDAAIAAPDVDTAVRCVLDLDDAMRDWAADTAQSDAFDRGTAALRRMVVRLGELARTGAQDPEVVVGPYVDALLAERAAARSDKRWADADRVRDALTSAGVEVRDTVGGTEWGMVAAE